MVHRGKTIAIKSTPGLGLLRSATLNLKNIRLPEGLYRLGSETWQGKTCR
jgi:hypothetical protein